jgi:putative transposase
LGRIVQEEWFRSASVRKEIRLLEDEFVVMPNHIHGIVWIDPDAVTDGVRPVIRPEENAGINDAREAGACHAPHHHMPQRHMLQHHTLQRKPRSLGSFIAGYKASVTSRAGRELNSANIWQRNYYEHIIRDQVDYERIVNYILENPTNWDKDDETH